MGRTGTTKINQDSFCTHRVDLIQAKDDKLHPKQEWLVVVADGHGALGHNVSQMIVREMPKTFEDQKLKFKKHVEMQKANKPKSKDDSLSDHQNIIRQSLKHAFL